MDWTKILQRVHGVMSKRLISYQNAHLSFGSNKKLKLTSREKVWGRKYHSFFFLGGGGGGGVAGAFAGGASPPPPLHWIEPCKPGIHR